MRIFLRTTTVWFLVAFVGGNLIAPRITIWNVAPDFSVIALVILALVEGPVAGCIGGFAIGLVEDLSNPPLLGLHALCKTILGFGLGRMRGHLVYGIPIAECIIVAAAVLAHDTVYLLVQSSLGSESFLRSFLQQALPAAIYSGLIGMPLLRLVDLFGLLRRED